METYAIECTRQAIVHGGIPLEVQAMSLPIRYV